MAIAEVIKYEGDNSTFIWKHPCEDFNTTSQLSLMLKAVHPAPACPAYS